VVPVDINKQWNDYSNNQCNTGRDVTSLTHFHSPHSMTHSQSLFLSWPFLQKKKSCSTHCGWEQCLWWTGHQICLRLHVTFWIRVAVSRFTNVSLLGLVVGQFLRDLSQWIFVTYFSAMWSRLLTSWQQSQSFHAARTICANFHHFISKQYNITKGMTTFHFKAIQRRHWRNDYISFQSNTTSLKEWLHFISKQYNNVAEGMITDYKCEQTQITNGVKNTTQLST